MIPSTRPVRSLLSVAILAVSSQFAVSADAYGPWQSKHNTEHPLVGQIWSLAEKKAVSEDDLVADLASVDAVLLGEIHDNPDHHALQARVIEHLVERGRKPAVVYEMIPRDFAEPLSEYLKNPKHGVDGLGQLLKWDERGWPDWKMYRPIAATALAAGLDILAGDLGRDTQRQIGRKGLDVLDADFRKRIRVDMPLDDARRDGLLEKLHDGHCGLLPKQALAPMLGVQKARDAALADAVLEGVSKGGAVLIAGAGHARGDWAVPWYVKQRDGDVTIRSVAFVEADPETPNALDYYDKGADGQPLFDYVWFTPRATLTDHCAELKERFSKKPVPHKKDQETDRESK